jgi:magnesium-transporting ATPase (P-type)
MQQEKKSNYGLFAAMIATSTVVMFGLMYLNTYELSHVRWSETRVYMAFLMGAVMAVIMLSFMRGMYHNNKTNLAIYLASLVVFVGALFLVRSQITVQDRSYMRAMIPHHSIAILTSERAQIADVRVRELADGIIEAQRREIKEMDWLIDDISQNGVAATQAEAEARPVPEFQASP